VVGLRMMSRNYDWSIRFAAMAGVAIVALALMAYGGSHRPRVGDKIDLPALKLLDGQRLPAGYFRGRAVVVEYWASWCSYCRQQDPYLESLALNTGGKGLDILAVSVDSSASAAKAYIQKHQYTFSAVMQNGALRRLFGDPHVIPELFVITGDGRIAEIIRGQTSGTNILGLARYARAHDGGDHTLQAYRSY
jgi:thiol-disulfide isomerase/thioredoxin